MSLIPPNLGYADPDHTDNYPPLRNVQIRSYYQVSGDTIINAFIGERDENTSYDSGISVGTSTSSLDPADEVVFRIRPGSNYAPIMLGWMKIEDDGVTYTETYEESLLTTAEMTFGYDDTTTTPWVYCDSFRVFRQPF